MNRRGFLKMLGKGAAAAAAPKGAIAKALTAESPVGSINTLLRDYIEADFSGKLTLPKIHSTFTTLFSFIKKYNLDSLLDKNEINHIQQCIRETSPEAIQDAIKKIEQEDLAWGITTYHPDRTPLSVVEANFFESGADLDAFDSVLNPLAQKNLIDKETAKVIKDTMGCDVRDFIQTPEMKAEKKKRLQQDAERAMKQYEYNKTARDINYSRMDKAGGAEDEGYAKYYEKVNTFDSLLSFIKEEDDAFSGLDMMADLYGGTGPIYRIGDSFIRREDKQIIHYYHAKIIDTTKFIGEINNMIDEGEGPTLTYPGHEPVGVVAALRHLNSGKLVRTQSYDDICYCRDKKPLEEYIRWRCKNLTGKTEPSSLKMVPSSLEMSLQKLNALP